MENKNIKPISVWSTVIMFGIIQIALGFFAWTGYQVAARDIEILPGISLWAGLGLWVCSQLVLSTPLLLQVLYQFALNTAIQKQYNQRVIESLIKSEKDDNEKSKMGF